MRVRRWNRFALAAFFSALLAGSAGCGGWLGSVDGEGVGDGRGPDREAPVIANSFVVPSTLRYTGGLVTLQTNVSDASGVRQVWVEISSSGSDSQSLALTASGSTYWAQWTAPANGRQDGASIVYTFRIHAQDMLGHERVSDPLTLSVEAPPLPPSGPTF